MLLFHERYKSQLNIFVMVLSCFIVISELCPLDHPNWRQSSHHSFASFFSVSPWLREQIWSSRLWTTGTVSCVGEFALWSWHPRISETCGRREDSFWECQFLFLYLSRSCSPPPQPSMLCHSFISFAHHSCCILMFGVELSKGSWSVFDRHSVSVSLLLQQLPTRLRSLFVHCCCPWCICVSCQKSILPLKQWIKPNA